MSKIQIIIIDDDVTARNTIKGYLSDHPLYEVVADFQEGRSALNWLQKNEVDILLCDMRMPNMDGLELIRLIHVRSPDLVVIAVSSFDDFCYTRGCLIEGAADYLLKHELSRESLQKVLDQVREKYRLHAGRTGMKNITGYCFTDKESFTKDTIEQMIKQEEILFDTRGLQAIVISPDYRNLTSGSYREARRDMCKAVCDMIAQILGDEYPFVYCITPHRHILLLISFLKENSTLFVLNSVTNFAARLRRTVMRLLDMTLTIAIGTPHLKLEDALLQTERLDEGMEAKFYLGGDRLYFYDQNPRQETRQAQVTRNSYRELSFALEQRDGETAQAVLREMCDSLKEQRAGRSSVHHWLDEVWELFVKQEVLTQEERRQRSDSLYAMELVDQIFLTLKELLAERLRSSVKQESGSVAIQKVREYVEQNFFRDVSLQDCADYAGISYTHLSRIFKQETGKRFVEYLNAVRLSHAKRLLIRQDLTMKEIVDETGFRNYNYFFKVFRENEGMTPTEFVSKNCSKP